VIAYLSPWIFDQRCSSLYVVKIVGHETVGFGQELARSVERGVETLKRMPPYLRWRLLETGERRQPSPVKAKCVNKVRLSSIDARCRYSRKVIRVYLLSSSLSANERDRRCRAVIVAEILPCCCTSQRRGSGYPFFKPQLAHSEIRAERLFLEKIYWIWIARSCFLAL
jgi:hypothetical protein